MEVGEGAGGGGGDHTEAVGREVEGVVMRISEEGMEREEREKRGESDLCLLALVSCLPEHDAEKEEGGKGGGGGG